MTTNDNVGHKMTTHAMFTVREESCWFPTPDCSDWEVGVVIDTEGAWLDGTEIPAVCSKQGRHCRFPVPAEWVKALCAKLRSMTIPAVPEPEFGCDGGYTELTVEGQVRYRWWSVPPKGWEPLDGVANEVLERFHDNLEAEA